jgi:hypothetical protein
VQPLTSIAAVSSAQPMTTDPDLTIDLIVSLAGQTDDQARA